MARSILFLRTFKILSLLIVWSRLLCVSEGFAQNYHEIPGKDLVSISDSGRNIRAHVYSGEENVIASILRTYGWVKGGSLFYTQGGYSGRLLDGAFYEFYPNRNLMLEGKYIKGLKDGRWSFWSEKGKLSEIQTWRSGVKHGLYIKNDSLGNLFFKANYKRGSLNGRATQRDSSGRIIKIYFRNSVIIKNRSFSMFKKAKKKLKDFFNRIF